jgi:hypothetical protein
MVLTYFVHLFCYYGYVPSVILLYWPYYYVQSRTYEHKYTIRFSRFIIFLQLFFLFALHYSFQYYGNISIFQGHEVPTSKRTHCISITKNNQSLLLSQMTVYCGNHRVHTNTLCGRIQHMVHINHCNVKG